MRKTLFYLGNLCFMMGLLLALWVTNGFQTLAGWQSKPFLPFVWGIAVLALTLALLLFTDRLAVRLEARSGWEIWGRGSICGLMIGAVWACLYLADLYLKEVELGYSIYLIAFGLAAALGMGLLAVVSDGFLRENLVGIGWLTVLGGWIAFGITHRLLGQWIAAAGVSLVLTVTLVTGRFVLRGRRGRRWEITREEDLVWFWGVVVVLISLIAFMSYNALRGALGYPFLIG